MQLLISGDQKEWLDLQATGLRNKSAIIRDLIDLARNGLVGCDTLAERTRDTPEQGEAQVSGASSSKAVTKKKLTNTSSKLLPPSLQAHEDLIGAFWKTKSGAKSDAGWKLLMTELGKIQDKYGDRVVRDQLELAAANRWKGVSFRNYEQFGLNKQPSRDSELDFEALDKIKMPW